MVNNQQHRPSPDSLPVMLFLSGNDGNRIESALRDYFAGKVRIVSPGLVPDKERSRQIVKDSVSAENPQIIVAVGEMSYLAMLDLWNDEVEVVVVNPYLGWHPDNIPCERYSNVFIHCTTLNSDYREMIIPRIEENCSDIRMFKSDLFGNELNQDGQKQLFVIIETVAKYQKLAGELMTLDEYENVVRQRPKPDTPGYYSLKIWSYDKSWRWKDEFSREVVDGFPTYRRQISSRQVEFKTKEEAVEAMHASVASADLEICAFVIERLPFGVVGPKPLWLEAWSYDAKGNLIQEASCSEAHAYLPGIYGMFLGHLSENAKWHKGDIVQIFHHYPGNPNTYATLGVVEDVSESTETVYKEYLFLARQAIRDGHQPDEWLETTAFGDDEMSVLCGPYCSDWSTFDFYNPMSVLPAPENLPDDIISELKSWHAKWQEKI